MNRSLVVVCALGLLLANSAASASDELPPITPDLDGVSAVACVRIGQSGAITGAFLLSSTGDHQRDGHLLQWIQQLHWPPAAPGEKLRDTWFPMPVAIGNGAKALDPPESCSPPPAATPQPAS
jgi:hypothetical protein